MRFSLHPQNCLIIPSASRPDLDGSNARKLRKYLKFPAIEPPVSGESATSPREQIITSVFLAPVYVCVSAWKEVGHQSIQPWVIGPQLLPCVDVVVNTVWRVGVGIHVEETLNTFSLNREQNYCAEFPAD